LTVRFTFTELVQMASEAKTPIDQYVRVAQTLEAHQNKLATERRSDPQSKLKLSAYLDSLNGDLHGELDRKDICFKAGVPFNQGNSMFARREITRILRLRDMRTSAGVADSRPA
jgi:hypothetical protein